MQVNRNTSARSASQDRRDIGNLAGLLERITATEGPINPNDRAVARIFLNQMKQRASDRQQVPR